MPEPEQLYDSQADRKQKTETFTAEKCPIGVLARLYAALELDGPPVAEDQVEQVVDQMQAIAWQAAEIRADTLQAIAFKASIFAPLCRDLESDVASSLGLSLCSDILLLEKKDR